MAKGARSKVLKRNNTKKREKLQKFENRRLERISNKLAEIVNSNDNVDVEMFELGSLKNVKATANPGIKVIIDESTTTTTPMEVEKNLQDGLKGPSTKRKKIGRK